MKSKKFIAALCALAVVVSSSGGLPFSGLRLFDTAVTASAEEKSVTFTATGTQDGITVSCRAYMRDSFFVNGSASKLTISSGSENITKLEITDSAMYPDRFTESHITVSAGNKSIQGGVLTVTDINAKSVTLSATDNKYWTTNKIVVYYGESAAATDISTATVNLAADNSVASIRVGDDTITDLSGFDITYGTDTDHTSTTVPTEAGTYYAYVTAKDTNTAYTGTAKSAEFTVASTDPAYTITIPATVDLKSSDPVEITAEGVTLNEGQKIVVTLDGASHTESGSVFSAKDKSGESVVKYKINDGAIGLDDANKTVAEFTEGGSKELSFAVTDETGIKFAGAHSEELTFGISVEEAVTAPTLAGVTLTDGMIIEPHCTVDGGDNWVQFKYVADDNKFVPNFNSYNDVYSKSDGPIMQPLADQWAWSTFEDHETPNGNFYLTQTGNTVHLRADDGINMNVIDLQLDFDNMTYTQLYKEWYKTVSGSFTSIKIGDTTITASQMTAN